MLFLKKLFPLGLLVFAGSLLHPLPTFSQTAPTPVDNSTRAISIRVWEMAKKQATNPPPPRPEAFSLGLKQTKKSKVPLGPGYYQHLQEARSAWQDRSKFNQYAPE